MIEERSTITIVALSVIGTLLVLGFLWSVTWFATTFGEIILEERNEFQNGKNLDDFCKLYGKTSGTFTDRWERYNGYERIFCGEWQSDKNIGGRLANWNEPSIQTYKEYIDLIITAKRNGDYWK